MKYTSKLLTQYLMELFQCKKVSKKIFRGTEIVIINGERKGKEVSFVYYYVQNISEEYFNKVLIKRNCNEFCVFDVEEYFDSEKGINRMNYSIGLTKNQILELMLIYKRELLLEKK